MAGLNAADRRWLDRYGEVLCRDYPEAVARLAVFGSKARGEAGPESDLDVLLVVRDDQKARLVEIERTGYELLDGRTLPQIVDTTESGWRRDIDRGMVFPNEVEDEAIDLIRDGVLVGTAATVARRAARRRRRPETRARDGRGSGGRGRIGKGETRTYPADAENRWRRALESLQDANVMVEGGRREGAMSCLYWAVFCATKAALFAVGVNARTHRATSLEFHERLIKTGILPEKWKGFYTTLMELRLLADYERNKMEPVSPSTARAHIRQTEEYLRAIRRELETRGIAAKDLPEDPAAGGEGT